MCQRYSVHDLMAVVMADVETWAPRPFEMTLTITELRLPCSTVGICRT